MTGEDDDYVGLEREVERTAERMAEESAALEEEIQHARTTAADARQPDLPGIVPEPDSGPEVNATYPNKRPVEDEDGNAA
jgi:hypothetical protein